MISCSEVRLIKNGCRAFFLLKYSLSIFTWIGIVSVCGYAAAMILIRCVQRALFCFRAHPANA